jgi:hypothetical protein
MKTVPRYPRRRRNTKDLFVSLVFSVLLLAVVMLITSCGGTFSLRPDGTLGYTTPRFVEITPSK